MDWFKSIKHFYETFDKKGQRLWTKEMVKNAVVKGKITEEQYKEITEEDYIINI